MVYLQLVKFVKKYSEMHCSHASQNGCTFFKKIGTTQAIQDKTRTSPRYILNEGLMTATDSRKMF